MLQDIGNTLSSAQAVTATAASTYVYDTHSGSIGGATRDISGQDCPLWLNFTVNTTTVSAGSTTMVITLESSAATALTSTTTHWTSASIAKATLVAGYQFSIPLPPGQYKRYVGARYTVATADFSAGAFTTHITDGVPAYTAYANNWAN